MLYGLVRSQPAHLLFFRLLENLPCTKGNSLFVKPNIFAFNGAHSYVNPYLGTALR